MLMGSILGLPRQKGPCQKGPSLYATKKCQVTKAKKSSQAHTYHRGIVISAALIKQP